MQKYENTVSSYSASITYHHLTYFTHSIRIKPSTRESEIWTISIYQSWILAWTVTSLLRIFKCFFAFFKQIEPQNQKKFELISISWRDIYHGAKLLNCNITINNSYPKRKRTPVDDGDMIKIWTVMGRIEANLYFQCLFWCKLPNS